MAITYFPFDAGAGAAITEGTWQKAARRWLATGVIRSYLNSLAVTADGTTLGGSVASGGAWIEGFYYESDAPLAFTVTAAHATLSRIDRVILRLDRTANTITQVVLAGTAAASPVAPTLTVTDTLWEIGLATVLVDPAVGVIAAGKVTDTRTLVQNGQKPIQGLAANLPTVRQQGLVYYATDTDVLYYDDGTATHTFSSTATADAAYAPRLAAGVRAHRSGLQTVATATSTAVLLNAETEDTSSFHDLVTNVSRITVPATRAGLYLITAQISWAATAATTRVTANLRLNGTTFLAEYTANGTAAALTHCPTSSLERLAVGDYIELMAYQTSGGNLDINGADRTFTWLNMIRVGA